MPALDKEYAEQVATAETDSGFEPMEEDIYEVELLACVAEKQGKPLVGAAGPYWEWTWQIPEDADRYKKRRFWTITSLSQKDFPKKKFREHFDAFNAATTINTDELIGLRCKAKVGQYVATQGKNKDTVQNQIEELYPSEGKTTPKGSKAKSASPDNF
jgi:hypothetical protein